MRSREKLGTPDLSPKASVAQIWEGRLRQRTKIELTRNVPERPTCAKRVLPKLKPAIRFFLISTILFNYTQ